MSKILFQVGELQRQPQCSKREQLHLLVALLAFSAFPLCCICLLCSPFHSQYKAVLNRNKDIVRWSQILVG